MDGEITFNLWDNQVNNNAVTDCPVNKNCDVVDQTSQDLSSEEEGLEDRECSQGKMIGATWRMRMEIVRANHTNLSKPHWDSTGAANQMIDDKIELSVSKLQQYFDKKFENLTKVMQLEKQLAENKEKLEQLKAKGIRHGNVVNEGSLNDGQSEVMIYWNAVTKK